MKIEIKERKLTEGKRTLYLEYYESGYRKRENLHLYLLPDHAVTIAKSKNSRPKNKMCH